MALDTFDEPYDSGSDYPTSDLGFSIANTNRKRKIFEPYGNAMDQFAPSHKFEDQYAAHLGAIPQEEPQNLKDKILTALVGGMTGFTSGPVNALNQVEKIKQRPYEDAIRNWKLKGAGLQELSGLEERQNEGQMRSLAAQNRFLKDQADLMFHYSKEDFEEQDKLADNARQEKLVTGQLANFEDLSANRAKERTQRDTALGLEKSRLANDTTRLNLQKERDADRKAKGSKPASPNALKSASTMAHALLAEKLPRLAALMDKDSNSLSPKDQEGKNHFILMRNQLADRIVKEGQLPDVEEQDLPEEESGGNWHTTISRWLSGGSSEER